MKMKYTFIGFNHNDKTFRIKEVLKRENEERQRELRDLEAFVKKENAERKAIKIIGENRTLKQTTEIFSDINIRLGSASFDSLL